MKSYPVPDSMIEKNLFPGRRAFADRRMEKELLLFADTRKSHARSSDVQTITGYLDYAESYGSSFDWIQLHSGYLFNHAPLAGYPDAGIPIDEATNAYIDRAIALCKSRGKKVCFTVGNYAPLDSLLEKYPEVRNLQNGLFFELIHDAVLGIFDRFPDLDEMGLYFFESLNILHFTNFFKCMNYGLMNPSEQTMEHDPAAIQAYEAYDYPYMSFGDHLRLMLQAAARACKERGKSLKVLTHVWFPFQEEMLLEAFRDFPPDLPVILEHNYTTGDFNPHLPFPAMIRQLPHLKHALVFCCGMEYHGLSLVPCCFPDQMQAVVHAAMDDTPNLVRLVVRPVWDGISLLGSPNEVNMLSMLRTADHPDTDMEEIWADWIRTRYHLTGAPAQTLHEALDLSYGVVRDIFFLFGIRANDHSHIPDFHHLESRLHNYGKAVFKWNPTPENRENVYDLLVRPGEKIRKKSLRIHDRALADIDQALDMISGIAELNPDDRADLRRRYEDMRTWVAIHQVQYDVYIRLLIHRRTPTEENRSAAEKGLQTLSRTVVQLNQGTLRSSYLFSPDHIQAFIQECTAQFDDKDGTV